MSSGDKSQDVSNKINDLTIKMRNMQREQLRAAKPYYYHFLALHRVGESVYQKLSGNGSVHYVRPDYLYALDALRRISWDRYEGVDIDNYANTITFRRDERYVIKLDLRWISLSDRDFASKVRLDVTRLIHENVQEDKKECEQNLKEIREKIEALLKEESIAFKELDKLKAKDNDLWDKILEMTDHQIELNRNHKS